MNFNNILTFETDYSPDNVQRTPPYCQFLKNCQTTTARVSHTIQRALSASGILISSIGFGKKNNFVINKMGKIKKEKLDETVEGDVSIKEEDTYEDKVKLCSIIAKPLAPKKLTKKCLKLIKKGLSRNDDKMQ